MWVQHVSLTNLRNYRRLEVDLTPGTTVLWGSNAAGKSSFLEALAMLATTHSPRAGAEREVIHWEAPIELGVMPFCRLGARVQRKDDVLTVEMSVQRLADSAGEVTGRCQKRFQVNRRPVRAREAAGKLQVVLFEPEDLNLITGSPARRRRYLDTSLMQADPRYWQSLQRYERVLLQRNQLLRRWKVESPPGAREQMAFWNRELVENGAYVTIARRRLVESLQPTLEAMHAQLSSGAATPPARLAMNYLPNVPSTPEQDEEAVAYAYRQALAAVWPRELERGVSLLGPHRDDVAFFLGDVDLAPYGSRGQQRTATVALKLAQVEWLREQSGEAPVILLDDVLSELDPERQGYLQGWLLQGGHQVIITATDLAVFRPIVLEQAVVYHVVAGAWEKQDQFTTQTPTA